MPRLPQSRRAQETMVAFLGLQPENGVQAAKTRATSFKKVSINFWPRTESVEMQQMECQDDMAVCNRECERAYGERQAELEEPCKLAVAKYYTGGLCFPSEATAVDIKRRRRKLGDIQVGEVLLGEGGAPSQVIALLHANPDAALYLQLQHTGGELGLSPHHLVAVQRRAPGDEEEKKLLQGPDPPAGQAQWEWIPAQDVRPGDWLQDERGEPLLVHAIKTATLQGAYAPLTESGALLVDGVLCSCYSPPAAWRLSHSTCHHAMLPLRFAENVRQIVEASARWSPESEPLLTFEVLWLLPRVADASLHPYAAGLMWMMTAMEQLRKTCCSDSLRIEDCSSKSCNSMPVGNLLM